MKAIVKFIENYIPGTDDKIIRFGVVLLKHVTDDNYTPTKEFFISFKSNCAVEAEEVINHLREFANKIELHNG